MERNVNLVIFDHQEQDEFVNVFNGRSPIGYISYRISSTGYPFILRNDYRNLAINNGLFIISYEILNMDGKTDKVLVLCSATQHELYNSFQERDFEFNQAFRRNGNVDTLIQLNSYDDAIGILIPIATYSVSADRQVMRCGLPPSNTSVFIATENNLENFYRYKESHCRLGKMLGTKIDIGLIIRHFGDFQRGGWGDARMMGIFGATGSGKTRFAAQVISAYAKYPEMGILIIDPQGQFSSKNDLGIQVGALGSCEDGTEWELKKSFSKLHHTRNIQWLDISSIAFTDPSLFVELLAENGYFHHFYSSISGAKLNLIRDDFYDFINKYTKSAKIKLENLTYSADLYQRTQSMITSLYTEKSAAGVENRIIYRIDEYNSRTGNPYAHQQEAERIWNNVLRNFNGFYKIHQVIDDILLNHKIIIISLVGIQDERIKKLYCAEILEQLRKRSEEYYHSASKRKQVNALIAIDEVQRLVGSGEHEDEINQRVTKKISYILTDCVKTSRKLSVGWLFITQTLKSLNSEIYRQLNTKVFGFGLATDGQEEILKMSFGHDKNILEQYRTLPIPIASGIYAFLTIGEMLPIGNGSTPIFINCYQNQDDLFKNNPSFFK